MLHSVSLSHCWLSVCYPMGLFFKSCSIPPAAWAVSAKGIAVLEGSAKLSFII